MRTIISLEHLKQVATFCMQVEIYQMLDLG